MKRNKLEIIRDILRIIQKNNSIKTTPLLRKSGLSSKRFYQYLDELENKNLVKWTHGKKQISLTENGFKYLEKYKNIVEFIEEFDL